MADNVPKLGALITGEAERDAVHVAVVPVKITSVMQPGQHVGVQPGTNLASETMEPIGIIDPFLTKELLPGATCYLFLYPGTVISLRHHYRHPVLDHEEIRRETMEALNAPAVQGIQAFAEEIGLSYEELMKGAEHFLKTGNLVEDVTDSYRYLNADPPDEFWIWYQQITGQRVPAEKQQENFFKCC